MKLVNPTECGTLQDVYRQGYADGKRILHLYAKHDTGCPGFYWRADIPGGRRCVCGLDALLEEIDA